MKYSTALLTTATAASAFSVANTPSHSNAQDVMNMDNPDSDWPEARLIETAPFEVIWVNHDDKWEMRRNGIRFFDITENQHNFPHVQTPLSVSYPSKPQHKSTVKKLAKELEKKNMRKHLEKFTSFHTRYYKSEYGIQSAEWLYGQIKGIIEAAGADKHGVTVEKFDHYWGQFSIIAKIPGKSEKTVVVGAHQDSINLFLPSILAAPGADDDGSGTVTILEALRVLLTSDEVVQGNATNTVEFHWYSAEEGGLLGSQAIFKSYNQDDRKVVAMLQQDMTGYVHKTIAAGEPESVGVITDYVSPELTEFIKATVEEYCDIPYIETKCGYACSDHASASKYGYPSAFVIESDFKYSDDKIHSTGDTIDLLSFDHMLQHAKMTLGYAYELAMAEL